MATSNIIIVLSALAMAVAIVVGFRRVHLPARLALASVLLAGAAGAPWLDFSRPNAAAAVNLLKLLVALVSAWGFLQGLRASPRLYLPLALGVVLLFGAAGTALLAGGSPWETRFWFAPGAGGPDLAIAAAMAGALLWHFWTIARRSPQSEP